MFLHFVLGCLRETGVPAPIATFLCVRHCAQEEKKMFFPIETVLSWAANMLQVGGAVFAALIWANQRRMERAARESVSVLLTLEGGGREVLLPLEIIRRDVSRAEILGRIGMLPMREKGARFSLRAVSTPAFMRALNEVVAGRTATLRVPCTQEELGQFEL